MFKIKEEEIDWFRVIKYILAKKKENLNGYNTILGFGSSECIPY